MSQSQWKSSLWIYNGFCPLAVVQVWRWRTQTQSWIRAVEESKRVLKMEFQCSSHDQASQSWKLPQCPPLHHCFWRRAACAPQPLQKSHTFSVISSSDLESYRFPVLCHWNNCFVGWETRKKAVGFPIEDTGGNFRNVCVGYTSGSREAALPGFSFGES